jgi:hypothetical protein
VIILTAFGRNIEMWFNPTKIVCLSRTALADIPPEKQSTHVWSDESADPCTVVETPLEIARLKRAWTMCDQSAFVAVKLVEGKPYLIECPE